MSFALNWYGPQVTLPDFTVTMHSTSVSGKAELFVRQNSSDNNPQSNFHADFTLTKSANAAGFSFRRSAKFGSFFANFTLSNLVQSKSNSPPASAVRRWPMATSFGSPVQLQ